MKRVQKTINNITPEIYASVALALCREYGWEHEDINDLSVKSQHIWTECVNADINMIEMCSEETGINVQDKVMEKDGV